LIRSDAANTLVGVHTKLIFALWLGTLLLGGCRSKGSSFPGSTYCDPKSGSSEIARSSLPNGACTGSATCLAWTAGEPCADATQAAGECQWTCTCVADAWDCTASCGGAQCTTTGDAALPNVDASTD
jgi:hypothetical protein